MSVSPRRRLCLEEMIAYQGNDTSKNSLDEEYQYNGHESFRETVIP